MRHPANSGLAKLTLAAIIRSVDSRTSLAEACQTLRSVACSPLLLCHGDHVMQAGSEEEFVLALAFKIIEGAKCTHLCRCRS